MYRIADIVNKLASLLKRWLIRSLEHERAKHLKASILMDILHTNVPGFKKLLAYTKVHTKSIKVVACIEYPPMSGKTMTAYIVRTDKLCTRMKDFLLCKKMTVDCVLDACLEVAADDDAVALCVPHDLANMCPKLPSFIPLVKAKQTLEELAVELDLRVA